jgi:1,4-dihydroxy-2-naphthoyl-CoA synthase
MSMISYDTARKLFVFRQFHTEGFVNTYVQQATADEKTIVFVSEAIENIPPGYRARETCTILSDDEFLGRFEIAEPGKEFELYSEARLKSIR